MEILDREKVEREILIQKRLKDTKVKKGLNLLMTPTGANKRAISKAERKSARFAKEDLKREQRLTKQLMQKKLAEEKKRQKLASVTYDESQTIR